MSELKRFEEWIKVDCNDCERWWVNQCDGVKDKPRVCMSYLATRKTVIPKQIESLQKKCEALSWWCLFLTSLSIFLLFWVGKLLFK